MQKYYFYLIKLILEKQITSKSDAYYYMRKKLKLSKKASILILDALLENQLLNYNFKTQLFMQ